jgi:hypothetical protein
VDNLVLGRFIHREEVIVAHGGTAIRVGAAGVRSWFLYQSKRDVGWMDGGITV